MIVCGLISYVLTSLSIYTIAGNRNIDNAWLAWIPIGNSWIVGSIADEYDARNGIKRKWRTILLVLSVLMVATYIFLFVFMMVTALTTFSNTTAESAEADVVATIMMILPIYIAYIVTILVAVVYSAFVCICNFKIYEATVPDKAVLYTILGMTVPLARPICLYVARNKYSPYTKIPYFPAVEAAEEASACEDDSSDVNEL